MYREVSLFFKNICCHDQFPGRNPKKSEKNWSPFEYQGELHFVYRVQPHVVFRLTTEGVCELVSSALTDVSWDFGEIRGGTPALPINDEEYLTIFHSSAPVTTLQTNSFECVHYFMGAYTFSRTPPFQVTSISAKPIIGKNFYSGDVSEFYFTLWGRKARVVFPCGIIIDENFVWVSFGKDRHEIWVTKFDKKGLLDSLRKVN